MGPIWGRQDPGGPYVGPWTLLFGDLLPDGTKPIRETMVIYYGWGPVPSSSVHFNWRCFGFEWLDMHAKVIQSIVQPHTPLTYKLTASWLASMINSRRPGRSFVVAIYIFICSLFIYAFRNSIPPITRFWIWKLRPNVNNNNPTFMFSDWQFDWSANSSCRDGAILMNSIHVIIINICQLWYQN